MLYRANCKINIGLDILRRRSDGYHELSTIMYPIYGLYDTLEIEVTDSQDVIFQNQGISVDCPPQKNICVIAAQLMQQHYGTGGVRITLEKNIPFGAGLGGGSADGTAIIMAINELYDLGLSTQELINRAAEIGSDTAFFVKNRPQLCQGRGEQMSDIDIELSGKWIAIIKPDAYISTREAYAGVTPRIPEVALSERICRPIKEWQGLIGNDFESHILQAHPEIAKAKQALIEAGAIYASMSGSGSAVYGIFENEKEARGVSLLTDYIYKV